MAVSCPYCAGDQTQVLESKEVDDKSFFRQRRKCRNPKCEKVFYTEENIAVSRRLIVVTEDGPKLFDSQKLMMSLLASGVDLVELQLVFDRIISDLNMKIETKGNPFSNSISVDSLTELIGEQLQLFDYKAYVIYRLSHTSCQTLAEFKQSL